MRLLLSLLLLAAPLPALAAPATPTPATAWDQVRVPPMKTSIYVGTVTLVTGAFIRNGDDFTSTYEARVRPWFFWSERGTITLTVPAAELERLARGQRIELTGRAFDHRQRLRTVTGFAEGQDATSGRIKIRIQVDGTELIFNGTYHAAPNPAAAPPDPAAG